MQREMMYAIYHLNHHIDFYIKKEDMYQKISLGDLTTDKIYFLNMIIPSEWVVFYNVSLPKMSASKKQQAITYQLEDKLINDIHQYHVIALTTVENESLVATISQDTLNIILEKIPGNFILKQMVTETLLMPLYQDKMTVLVDEDKIFIRALNTVMLAQKSDLPRITADKSYVTMGVEEENAIVCLEQYLLSQLSSLNKELNLLKKEHRSSKAITKKARYIYMALFGMLGVFLFFLLMSSVEIIYLQTKNHRLNNQVSSMYYQLFPSAKTIVAPRERVQQLLNQQGVNNANTVFLYLLSALSRSTINYSKVTINHILFVNDELTLNVNATTSAEVDEFIKLLASNGVHTSMQSSDLSNGQAKAVIVIKR